MSNRVDELLAALLNGETADITPQSRVEALLKALIDGAGTEGLPAPQSSMEAYLHAIVEKGLGGGPGGGSGGKIVINNMRHFYYYGARLEDLPPETIDSSNAEDFQYSMAYNAITKSPALDTSNCKVFESMFQYCKQMTEFSGLDTSKGTTFKSMFFGCEALTSVNGLDVSNATSLFSLFYGCKALTESPPLNSNKCTDFTQLFSGCKKLVTIRDIDTSVARLCPSMFEHCEVLETAPRIEAPLSSFDSMFSYCYKLKDVPFIDARDIKSSYSVFNYCECLENVTVRNIKHSLKVASGTSYGHLLTVDSLVGLIYELRDTGSSKTLTIGSANREKLANVYVTLVTVTDEMRTEDDLIDEKMPFRVCSSIDDGAMLITDYPQLKNWIIQ